MFYIPNQDIVMERTRSDNAAAAASTFLPPSFLPHPTSTSSVWQDRTIMALWTLAVLVYFVFLSPLLVVSIVFWIVAVEFALETMTTSSLSGEFLDDDNDNNDHGAHDEGELDDKKQTTKLAQHDEYDDDSDESAWYEWPLGPL